MLLAVSVVAAVVLSRHYHLSNGAALVGLVGGVTGLTGLWLTWAAYKADREEAAAGELDLAGVADQLAIAVRRLWEDEAALRRLNDPYPLPVRWDPADSSLVDDWASLVRLATSGAGWPTPPPPGTWATGPGGLAGSDAELAGLLDRVPTGRLVVLGEPGSGKTMLMVRLVLDLLAPGRRAPGGPIPALVALASWNPYQQGLYDWLERRLVAVHRGLAVSAPGGTGASRARALLDAGLILAILDGLDEMPDPVRGAAIARINDDLRPGQRLVLSSRTADYQQAISPTGGPEVRLTGAAGIELLPLEATAVAGYLRGSAGGPAGAARWDPLLTAWPPPVAQALVAPLMASLARTIYNLRPGEPPLAAGRSPVELLDPTRFPTSTAVGEHLFDAFIPAAYRRSDPAQHRRWKPADAERWLSYLARHLDHTLGGALDLSWWQLSLSLSAFRLQQTRELLRASIIFGLGLGVGLPVGLAYGSNAGLAWGLTSGLGSASIIVPPRRGYLEPRQGVRSGGLIGRLTNSLMPEIAILLVAILMIPLLLFGGRGIWIYVVVGVQLFSWLLVGGFSTSPADLTQAVNPTLVLRQDREAFISLTLRVQFLAGFMGVLIGNLAGGPVIGLVAGLMMGVGSGMLNIPWGDFMLARTWLTIRGRLPWRLMAFLGDAHRRGVLRQVGAAYQFRHIELQHRLAGRQPPGTP
ncbi:NACHT domain-containing NTPase [Frankia sp. AiPs1]|uniref:NACHT domain-containing protein n=1 Tax=Frankia sp. AiPs1 TaxID=573493 RepID=UPI0020440176|nr:hypothetical protein [Frankia sp. AiPs1]